MTKRGHKTYRGISIIEILLALAICATLLTALTAGIQASIAGYKANDAQAQLATKSRNIMSRLLDQIRRSGLHRTYTTTGSTYADFLAGATVTDVGFSLIDTLTNGSSLTYCQYTYWYDSSDANNGKIRVIAQPGTLSQSGVSPAFTPVGNATSAVLLTHVTAFSITLSPGRSNPYAPNCDVLTRASIAMEIQDPDTSKPDRLRLALSGSATSRQIVWTGNKLPAPLVKYVSGYSTAP